MARLNWIDKSYSPLSGAPDNAVYYNFVDKNGNIFPAGTPPYKPVPANTLLTAGTPHSAGNDNLLAQLVEMIQPYSATKLYEPDGLCWYAGKVWSHNWANIVSCKAGEIICTLGGRVYKKFNDEPAYIAVMQYTGTQNWSSPILVGRTSTSTQYSYVDGQAIGTGSAFTFNGETWYVGMGSAAMYPFPTNTNGKASYQLPTTYTGASIALDAATDLLEYVIGVTPSSNSIVWSQPKPEDVGVNPASIGAAYQGILTTLAQVNDYNMASGVYDVENVTISGMTSTYFSLVHVNGVNSYAGQLWIAYESDSNPPNLYFRKCKNGTWDNFYKIYNAGFEEIVEGSYTGNGASSRTIDIGFTPHVVFIKRIYTTRTSIQNYSGIDRYDEQMVVPGAFSGGITNTAQWGTITISGTNLTFQVDNADAGAALYAMNSNGASYKWFAVR